MNAMHASLRWLRAARTEREFAPLDLTLARLMATLDPAAHPLLPLAAAAVSQALEEGDTCLPLAALEGLLPAAATGLDLAATLAASPLVTTRPEAERAPLVLTAGALQLRRHALHEARLAAALHARCGGVTALDAPVLRQLLGRLFDLRQPGLAAQQALAVLAGLRSRLTVITGGPGTGKTRTVLQLLAARVLAARAVGAPVPRIALAAPTGKAAARVSESIRAGLDTLGELGDMATVLPEQATTLHRLLGVRFASSRFRHDAEVPLDLDVLVVDEASMVDLVLARRLLDALPPRAALVLIGDAHQLASVEAGNVLSSICEAAGDGVSPAFAGLAREVLGLELASAALPAPFADHVVALAHNWRSTPGIDALARDVLAGDVDAVLGALAAGRYADVTWHDAAGLHDIHARIAAQHAAVRDAADVAAALAQAGRLGILTAMRGGAVGADAINREADLRLGNGAAFYRGRLILINRNDVDLGLFNGDVGVIWPDAAGALQAWFPAAAGPRPVAPALLPDCTSAWAITVHKSQGSEYDRVLLVLPPAPTRVLGRELVYTGITRARRGVTLSASPAVLRHALARSARRSSGLKARLLASADA